MTEEELLNNFEAKVRRYLSESDGGVFAPAATEYFDAAQNLGASLLLRMVKAYQNERLADRLQADRDEENMAPLRADVQDIATKIMEATNASQAHGESVSKLKADLAKAQDELRATVRQATAMEYAGCDAIAALRSVESNPGLTDAQHALVAEALLGMFAAKPRWLSRPAETGRNSPNLDGAA